MPDQATAMPRPLPLDADRFKRLGDELRFALSRTDAKTLREWGARSARRLIKLIAMRMSALVGLLGRIGRGMASEGQGFQDAFADRRVGTHLGDRTAAAIDNGIGLTKDISALVKDIGRAVKDDPKNEAPKLLAAFLGFYAGSGGVDGDGGIPDLDLLAGIDAHRALLTHSLLAGALAEGILLAMIDLSGQIADRLPLDHDPLWDKLAQASTLLSGTLTTGMSAGIAYHLLWDAAIEPAPYHGLPVEMPMEAHTAILAANGAAEGAYAAQTRQRKPITINNTASPTTGRKIVNAIANTAERAGQSGRSWFGKLKH